MLKCGDKKRNWPDIGGERDGTVKREYDRQRTDLEGVPSGVVCRNVGSHSTGMQTPNIIEEVNKDVPERVPISVVEFSDIPQQAAKQGHQWTAL